MFRKKNMSVFTAFLLLFSCIFSVPFNVSAASFDDIPEWDGSSDFLWYNDSESVFHLSTPEELAGLSYLVNSKGYTMEEKTIYLDNDISLSGLDWTPIGGTVTFKGIFNAQNHKISNLKSTSSTTRSDVIYIGLFGKSAGEIRNVSLTASCNIDTTMLMSAAKTCYGYGSAICSYNEGLVFNCVNSAPVSFNWYYYTTSDRDIIKSCCRYLSIGGICGYNSGEISNCVNLGTIQCHNITGDASSKYGVAPNGQYINNNYVKIGGICGESKTCINNSRNHGSVLSYSFSYSDKYTSSIGTFTHFYTTLLCLGGIRGVGSASQCQNSGSIYGEGNYENNIGGIAGSGSCTLCSNLGNVEMNTLFRSISHMTGGISSGGGTISNCYNLGNIINGKYQDSGGICGSDLSTIQNSFNTGSCDFGIAKRGTINNCYYLGTSSAQGTSYETDPAVSINSTNMKKENFAKALGDAFVYVENAYPKLAWETEKQINYWFDGSTILMTWYCAKKQIGVYPPCSETITYLSSDPTVVSIDSEGYVTALNEGTAQVYAIFGESRAECTVTVKYNYQNYYLNPAELELKTGETESLSLISEATGKEADLSEVKYTSSDQNIATVSESGAVTAIAEGQCTITAELLGGKLTCTVTVTKPAETEPINKDPVLNVSELKVDKGKSSELSVQNYSGTVTWISADTTIATVKANSDTLSASITGVKKGTATIYAMLSNGKALTCTVTVEEGTPTSGDITGDGKFTVLDAIALQKYLICEDVTLKDWKAGDFNNDNALTAIDLTLMKRALLNP